MGIMMHLSSPRLSQLDVLTHSDQTRRVGMGVCVGRGKGILGNLILGSNLTHHHLGVQWVMLSC